MNDADAIGLVHSRVVDQLVFVALGAVPFVWLASVKPLLALYAGLRAYIGFVLKMPRSTPCSLLLPLNNEHRVVGLLDHSSFFRRNSDGRWQNTKGDCTAGASYH